MPQSPAATAASPASPLPPLWRDPWAWAVAAAILPLIARAWGAPLGQPFADDFHFLHHALFGTGGWLDGGGAVIYWRPLSRQAYFGLLAPVLLSMPWLVALFHAVALALAGVLLYRAWRSQWTQPAAAVAASFPMIAEASRGLLLWPSAFQDLGALAFSALALHQASRRRLATAVPALVAALLCKEIAVVTAVLLPWVPWNAGEARERRRWLMVSAVTVLAWGVAYATVMRGAGLMFQRHLEAPPPPLPSRFAWALGQSLSDAFGLGALGGSLATGVAIVAAALIVLGLATALITPAGRERLASGAPWIAWGMAWFVANAATLTEVYPVWGPFRSGFGMVGLGIALAATLAAAGPLWLAALTALRLATLFLAPGPPPAIAPAPYGQGASLDFASLTRLSRLVRETESALRSSHPRLPAGATLVWVHRALLADHAFAEGKAFQVWYRDPTMRLPAWDDVLAGRERSPDAALEFETSGTRQVATVSPSALTAYLEGVRAMEAESYSDALMHLGRADSLQSDRAATAFLATVTGKRAVCLLGLENLSEARGAAEASLAAWPLGSDPRYVLAVLLVVEGRGSAARAQLDTLLDRYPYDVAGRALRDTLEARGIR